TTHTSNSDGNVTDVLAYFYARSNSSERTAARDLAVMSSIRKILKEHKFYPYKFSLTCAMNLEDTACRPEFYEMILVRVQEEEYASFLDGRVEILQRRDCEPKK
ncbi:hypothetical protein HHI36_005248, partial [Cryptolaemus montrouzieri]